MAVHSTSGTDRGFLDAQLERRRQHAQELVAWAVYHEETQRAVHTPYYDQREVECWRRLKKALHEAGIHYGRTDGS